MMHYTNPPLLSFNIFNISAQKISGSTFHNQFGHRVAFIATDFTVQ